MQEYPAGNVIQKKKQGRWLHLNQDKCKFNLEIIQMIWKQLEMFLIYQDYFLDSVKKTELQEHKTVHILICSSKKETTFSQKLKDTSSLSFLSVVLRMIP